MPPETARRSLSSSRRPESSGACVTDGRWIAYISNETGRQEIFVQPFAAGGNKMTGKWMVSRSARGMARWRSDSKELMFVGLEGDVVTVDVTRASRSRPARQEAVSDAARSAEHPAGRNARRYHARPAALAPCDAGSGERSAKLDFVLNWQAGLQR